MAVTVNGASPSKAQKADLRAAFELAPSAAVASGVSITGLTEANTLRFRTALAATIAGTADTFISINGDSNVMGHTTVSDGARVWSWPVVLSRLLKRSLHNKTRIAGIYGDQNSPVAYPLYDTRVVYGTGWSAASGGLQVNGLDTGGIGGLYFKGDLNATGSLAVTPEVKFDRARIWFTKYSTAGTATVNIDGGAALATMVGGNATESMAYVDISTTYGYHTINVTGPTVGNFYVTAIEWSVSTEAELLVRPMGKYGKRTADIAEASKPWSSYNALTAFASHMALFCLTINDSNNSTPLATYGSQLNSAVSRQLEVGDAVIMASPSNGTTQGLNGQYQTYAAKAAEVATALGVPFLDLGARWGQYNEAAVLGMWANTNHPSQTVGYPDIADQVDVLFRAIRALG
jgi:hypothetical protein